ncbi:hypothetical protein CR513_25382, partial [Mucuna pruriens]
MLADPLTKGLIPKVFHEHTTHMSNKFDEERNERPRRNSSDLVEENHKPTTRQFQERLSPKEVSRPEAVMARLVPSQLSPASRPKTRVWEAEASLVNHRRSTMAIIVEGGANSKDVSAQKKRLGLGGTNPTRLVPSQPSPTSRSNPLQRRKLIVSLMLHSLDLVHSIGNAWCFSMVSHRSRRCNLEFGKRRSSSNILYELDPKIDKTLRRLRKVRSFVVSNSSSSNFVSNSDNVVSTTNDFDFSKDSSSDINPDPNLVVSNFQEPEQMENNDEYSRSWPHRMWCTSLGASSIHNWNYCPNFMVLPPQALKFHVVCSTMRPQGILEDYIKMKAFPFFLDGAAKDWLYLQLVLFNS